MYLTSYQNYLENHFKFNLPNQQSVIQDMELRQLIKEKVK